MEQKIDSVLAEPLLKKGRFTLRTADFILLLAVTAIAFLARFGLFSYVSGDYTSFLSNWFDTLKNAGGLAVRYEKQTQALFAWVCFFVRCKRRPQKARPLQSSASISLMISSFPESRKVCSLPQYGQIRPCRTVG